MKKRLFIYTTVIFLAGLLVFFAASVYMTNQNNLSFAKDTVMETARICAGLYGDGADATSFVKAGGDTRITVISPDGKVLADSRPVDVSTMENHLTRPEIQAAINGSPEAYVRYSETLGVDYIYYALKVTHPSTEGNGGSYVFIRAAIPVARMNEHLFQFIPLLCVIFLAVALLCFVFSRGMIIRITKPFESVQRKLRLLSTGEYTPEPAGRSYEEIDAIIRQIDEVALILRDSLNDLRDEKNKANYILDHIGDGIIAFDEDGRIALINSAALGIFGVTPDITGKNIHYLSNDKTLSSAAEDCIRYEKSSLFELTLEGRIYLVTVKRPPDTRLTMVILSDVTDNRENAKRREEFFANASHELKTPLTAIKGFNELTAINNEDERIGKYIEGITRETNRMLALIADMLRLSELESARSANPVPISLAKAVDEVRDTLSAAIREKAILFETVGDGTVEAEQGHVYELIKNLVENAVRYNNPGGRVSVTIEGDKKNTWLFIFDNGIGISPEEQTRIFERFYRVEKSRSGRSGGTGLGLSIVKHICALYGWKLSLKSKPGVGTEITVEFGAENS